MDKFSEWVKLISPSAFIVALVCGAGWTIFAIPRIDAKLAPVIKKVVGIEYDIKVIRAILERTIDPTALRAVELELARFKPKD